MINLDKLDLKEKEYFTSGEVSDIFYKTTSRMQYYVRGFEEFLDIKRDKLNYRIFTKEDIIKLDKIIKYMRTNKMNLRNMKEYIRSNADFLLPKEIVYTEKEEKKEETAETANDISFEHLIKEQIIEFIKIQKSINERMCDLTRLLKITIKNNEYLINREYYSPRFHKFRNKRCKYKNKRR